jgi:maleylpyruvate isomerase
MKLHGYFRSTATWRVRIALGWKGLAWEPVDYDLRTGAQRRAEFLAVNPQGFVPALELDDGTVITQSPAILEWLEEVHPVPPLLPAEPLARARVRAVAAVIACDIHPVQNLSVLGQVRALGGDPNAWARAVIARGLDAVEALIGGPGPFAFGAAPTLADVLIVPQMGNARRFGVELRWPRIAVVEAACAGLSAFEAARPERQPGAG